CGSASVSCCCPPAPAGWPASGRWTSRSRAGSRTPLSRTCRSRSPNNCVGRSAAMASTETTPQDKAPQPTASAQSAQNDLAGLDALDAVQIRRTPVRQVLVRGVLPPVTAVVFVLVVWQGLVSAHAADTYKLPGPGAV